MIKYYTPIHWNDVFGKITDGKIITVCRTVK